MARKLSLPSIAFHVDRAPAIPVSAAKSATVEFSVKHQETENWCWAAVASSVFNFFKKQDALSQCKLASEFSPNSDCCSDANAAGCDVERHLEDILRRTGNFRAMNSSFLSGEEIQDELSQHGAPIACTIQWTDLNRHYVVITGISEANGTFKVDVKDPLFESGTYEWMTFATAYQPVGSNKSGSWKETIFTQPSPNANLSGPGV
jgi:hypothetical protein